MKKRLSASIDEDLLAAAEAAVREGYAPSMSALVEDALRAGMERQRLLAAADDWFAELDAERGYSPAREEIDAAVAEARANALRPNGPSAKAARRAEQDGAERAA